MLADRTRLATKIRKRRLALRLSQREVARRLGCSQAYLHLVEHSLRPLSPPKALQLEVLLGAKRGTYVREVRRGRPPLTQAVRRVLKELRLSRGLPKKVEVDGRAPKFPRPDTVKAGVNPFWPMAIHLGPASAARVKDLEAVRAGDDKFWRLANSLRFDSWCERDLVVQVGQECLELTGVSPDLVGCSLAVVCGKTGRDAGRRAHPAFLLEYRGASIAWFQQRCVRTAKGHRWPDSILVVSRNGQRKTLVAELDGPEFHKSRWREVRRDAELGLPVVHVHPAVSQQPDGLRRILDWAVSQVA